MKDKKNKILVSIILVVTLMINSVFFISTSEGKMKKVSEPILPKAGDSYFLDKEKTSYIKIRSKDKKSVLYYTMNGKKPNKRSKRYKKPILLERGFVLNIVNTKKGYKNSKVVKKKFIILKAAPILSREAIECETMIAGIGSLNGTLKLVEKGFTYYIYAEVEKEGKEKRTYRVEVKEGKWNIILDSPLEKGTTVRLSAYTKEMRVNFVKGSKKNELRVYSYCPYLKNVEENI